MRNFAIYILAAALAACSAPEHSEAQTEISPAAPVAAEAVPSSILSVARIGNPEGRTVVLIPGLASSADVWDAAVPYLEAEYDVRLVQVAGFAGAAPAEVDGPVTDAIAAALVDMLTENPGLDPVLVGHSMGGFVSVKAALLAPDMIDELVIVDSVPFLAGLFFPGATPDVAAVQGPAMAQQMAAMSREAFDAQQQAGLPRLVKTESFVSELAGWGAASDQAVVSAVTGEMIGADLRADLAGLHTEALIMVPYDQAMGVPREQIEGVYAAQYDAAPNARFDVIENSFHFIMIDQPEAFQTSLLEALAD